MNLDPDWLIPDWQAPGVKALMTTRRGGASVGPFDSLNLRGGIGDDDAAVAANQARLEDAIGARPVYLDQVHGTSVVRLDHTEPRRQADASVTSVAGVVCAVQVADCLPVLFAAPQARAVGAAHAGWRGLAGGVLENTVNALCEAAACTPAGLQAWLGACIGPRRFEVGADVLAAFGASQAAPDPRHFVPSTGGKWLANLPQLARDRLRRAGVSTISGGDWCTVEDASRFYSYRRDRVTGRMAAAVWIEPRRRVG